MVAGGEFPAVELPVKPGYAAMEAPATTVLPGGEGWWYEPKWDGFRCPAFKDGGTVVLQSKAGQPLTRYFPEIVAAVRALPAARLVLDGELVLFSDGRVDSDSLLQRIHPAASRLARLAAETPCTIRWRPDKAPAQCTYAQLESAGDPAALARLGRRAG